MKHSNTGYRFETIFLQLGRHFEFEAQIERASTQFWEIVTHSSQFK